MRFSLVWAISLTLFSSSVLAQGFNSAPGSDLPLGAGGTTSIIISGGGTSGVPVGNVGVGTPTPRTKLDVAGEIRSGNTNTACSATNAGAIRYNSSTKIMEYCNSSAWTSMGGGSTGSLCGWGQSVTGTEWYGCSGGSSISCMGYPVVKSDCSKSCPSGYSAQKTFAMASSAGNDTYVFWTCVKN